MKNVMLAVDTKKINYAINRTYIGKRAKLDYQKYKEMALGEDVLFKATAYGINNAQESRKFEGFLKNAGFVTHFHNPITRKNPHTQLEYTEFEPFYVPLTIDVMQMLMLGKIDRVVLGVADNLYIPLVRFIKAQGVTCEIFACHIPFALKGVADKVTEIDESLFYSEPIKVEQ